MNIQFKALQDPTRRRILDMLKVRDLTASDIAAAFDISAPSISYHLDLLRRAGLVSSQKKGQFVTYSLETTVLDESLSWILDLMKKGNKNAKQTKNKPSRVAGSHSPHRPFPLPGGAMG
jgi:DNA-binding transcriptional ArsR family regulator